MLVHISSTSHSLGSGVPSNARSDKSQDPHSSNVCTLSSKDIGGHQPVVVSSGSSYTVLLSRSGKCIALGLSPMHTAETLNKYIIAPAKAIQFKQIACGHSHILAISNLGKVWCWGNNSHQQLGLPTCKHLLKPELTSALQHTKATRIINVSAGKRHSLALCEDGAAFSWGSNEYGQLGVENIAMNMSVHSENPLDNSSPKFCCCEAQNVETTMPLMMVVAGWEHSAFLSQSGSIMTSGWGMYVVLHECLVHCCRININL